jgi:hypothetical protein
VKPIGINAAVGDHRIHGVQGREIGGPDLIELFGIRQEDFFNDEAIQDCLTRTSYWLAQVNPSSRLTPAAERKYLAARVL